MVGPPADARRPRLAPVAGEARVLQAHAFAGFDEGEAHRVARHLWPVDASLVSRHVDAVHRVASQQGRFFASRQSRARERGPRPAGVAVELRAVAGVEHAGPQQTHQHRRG